MYLYTKYQIQELYINTFINTLLTMHVFKKHNFFFRYIEVEVFITTLINTKKYLNTC